MREKGVSTLAGEEGKGGGTRGNVEAASQREC